MSKELTTTNIGKSHQQILKQIAKKLELSQVEFLNGAIQYFRKTGINPLDEITNPKEELASLNKRLDQVIGFIRVHEQNKLSPLLDSLIAIDRRLKDKLEFLLDKTDIAEISERIEKRTNELKQKIESARDDITNLKSSISTLNQNYITGYKNQNADIAKTQQLIGLIFRLLINKKLSGYSIVDIQNFENALPKVR